MSIGPKVEFISAGPFSSRVRCSVCGRVGWPTNGGGWQKTCFRGHRPCFKCGRMLSVKQNGEARLHARCPA